MGKTYVDTVKYLVRARFEVDGLIEKPDIVGAIFGQTEGLLGDELDLRELQKNGRIGRIEVETQNRGGKTLGTIVVPSSLDMVETAILAASLEIVDRVGPCEARVQTEKIEDSRNLKRKQLLDRAKNLLKSLITEEMPESKELAEMVRENVKTGEIGVYGEDKLPAGPDVVSSNEIIVCEGRADVVNLLKNDIKNAVAIGGAKVGKTVIELCKQKEVTLFLDGDRGGDIILREMMSATDIDFVARAPPGKEVEELSRKELIKCLRRRVPVEQADTEQGTQREYRPERGFNRREERDYRGERPERGERFPPRGEPAPFIPAVVEPEPVVEPVPVLEPAGEAIRQEALTGEEAEKAEKAKVALKELEGSLRARVLDAAMNTVAEVPIREIMKVARETEGVHAIVLDGIVTQRLLELAEQKNVRFVAGLRAGTITRQPPGIAVLLSG